MLLLVGSPVVHNNLVASLPIWGSSYRLTFSLYINSFDGKNLRQGKWAELLRVTRTNNNCCAIGDRIPAIFTNKGGFIQVGTQIGAAGNKWKNVNMNEKTWYKLDIIQYQWNNKVGKRICVLASSNFSVMFQYYFELRLDGVRKWRLENRNPRSFSNVKVWAARCRHGFPPANAYIDNLQYEFIGKLH